ncbi:hypothetical protein AX15_002029 [Amanita polypyramis BW_CC]|nr:hypothetical protein AX15_002029 [Amanita polypyramis BW_CC]
MTDLTVLISPTPLYSHMMNKRPFSFRRSTPSLHIKPVMVTLETEREASDEGDESGTGDSDVAGTTTAAATVSQFSLQATTAQRDGFRLQSPVRRRGRAQSRTVDPNLLSPPVNTWKASDPPNYIKRHRPTRSQSAPPARHLSSTEEQDPSPPIPFSPILPSTAIARSFPRRSFTSYSEGAGGRFGTSDLLPPPPPLLRPTTFWRKTRRSGVTAASYSPSYHLIRRSTFIAAGLDFDTPTHDLSAFSVENRVGFIVVPPDHSLQ